MECESILECRFSRSRVVHHIHLNITPSGGISTFFITYLKLFPKNANADLKHDKNANNQQLQYDLQFEMIFFLQLLKRNKGLHQVTTSTYLFGVISLSKPTAFSCNKNLHTTVPSCFMSDKIWRVWEYNLDRSSHFIQIWFLF